MAASLEPGLTLPPACLLLAALLGPREMSDLSPQREPKRTLIRSLSPIAIFKRTDFKRFVTIGRSADNARAEIGFAHAEGLSEHLLRSPHESHVVLDLQKLFKRLERTGG